MTDKPFVHLHVHSEYSLLDGANKCPDLAKRAAEFGMNALALTDHGVMYGCVDLYLECNKVGVKPIMGCELYVDPEGHLCQEGKRKNNHLVLLAENEEGYHNLMTLVSIANTDGFYYKPRIDHELLAKYHKGLIASSACLAGEIPQFILSGDEKGAADCACMYRDILGEGNFFLELQHNSVPEQAIVNKRLVDIARKYNFPLVATNDAHYLNREDSKWHDVLLCIGTNSSVDNPNRYKFTGDDYYFRSPEEMWNIFGSELPEALINTQEIADRCNVKLEYDTGHYYLPEFPIPEGETLNSHLKKLANEGLRRQLKTESVPEEYQKRLDYELSVIERMDFPGYFLIVSDIIMACKSRGIPIGPGRGSAAGSLVAWSLGITELDPLRFDLLFERFLNPERISMPDIDTDVSDKQREELIAYVVQKYGKDHVAQIITFDRMMIRAAITDVGRALDMPVPDVRKVTKLIPNTLKTGIKTIPEAINMVPDLKQLYDNDPKVKRLLDFASPIVGLARHCGQHAAGVVITPKPLIDMVPLRKFDKQNREQIVTQYSMDPVAQLGLVKMDFLGLKTLSMIQGALRNIERNGKGNIDITEIPLDDEDTFKMLQRGDTLGVFQLESAGMTELIKRLKPDCFEDMVALVAMYRPGPLESGMVESYVRRKHNEEKIQYFHPALEKCMRETYGVMLYQEQVMQSASILAGYTLGQADKLRKAMGKKKKEVMAEQRDKFVAGATKNNVTAAQANDIFDKIEKFAGYGFNKSHSVAYALISYRTAWLKAHYPAEFLASYLTSVIGSGMEELGNYIRRVRDDGYEVLPPDINESMEEFSAVNGIIRLGLSGIAKAGDKAVASIVAARSEGGNFKSFWDFCKRVSNGQVNKGVVESLAKAGAFDSLEPNRASVLKSVQLFMDVAARQNQDNNQGSLFVGLDDEADIPQLVETEDFSLREKLEYEKESTGLYISGHPFDKFENVVAPYITCPLKNAGQWQTSKEPLITAGLLSSSKERFTKKGDPMGIITLEDAVTKLEVVLFPKVWAVYKPFLVPGELYIVKGQPKEDRGVSVLADEIYTEQDYKEKLARHFTVVLDEDKLPADEVFFRRFVDVLARHKGNAAVRLKLTGSERNLVSLLRVKVDDTDDSLKEELTVLAQDAVSFE
ncbi:MAG: DNA polymerase III subunit alpha [Synergistaceae bacterium]|nr:DNA polymerase III subunit alpha [Candidatus Equadaptatus faecalis]